jgi:hypothetical protein
VPLAIRDGTINRLITSIEIKGEISADGDGQGTVLLDDRPLMLNTFGDATPGGPRKQESRRVAFRRTKDGVAPMGVDLRAFEIVFADGSLSRQLFLALAGDTAHPHRLLFFRPEDGPRPKVTAFPARSPMRLVDLHGLPAHKDAFSDRLLGTDIHFTTLYDSGGQPRQFLIRGTLNGPGQLELDPNSLMLDSFGHVQGSTMLGYRTIDVKLAPVEPADPAKKGRRLYHILPKSPIPERFSLVLMPGEVGPHRLLLHEKDAIVQVLTLVDPRRQEHLWLESRLATTSDAEKKAIAALRKVIGYGFHYRIDQGAVTFLSIRKPIDAKLVDPALRGLTKLQELHFTGRLGPAGLGSLKMMPRLKRLDLSDSLIDDAGLACVKDLTGLEHLLFFGCRGLTDKGLTHLAKLTNLKLLDLRNEGFTETEPAGPRITDAGLVHLAGLTKLTYLNLQGQKITDAGLESLKGLKVLRFLALSFSDITDEGLKHLEGLAQLRELHLYNTLVTSEGRVTLRTKLPKLDRGP